MSLASSQTGVVQSIAYSPEIVSWNVTQRCNLQCSHCYLVAGGSAPAELSFEEGCQLVDQLAASGTRMLILSGGEPLMRRDIVKLAVHASSTGMLVVLGTNGMLLTHTLVRELKDAGVAGAGISLDSVHPERHDSFRGVPGAWKGAVRGIQECVAQGLPVLLQMTALPWNYQEIPDMVEFAHREGASAFNLYFLVCTGRGETLTDITPQRYEDALSTLVEAQGHYPQMMVRARCAPQIGRVGSQQGSALVGSAGCLAARQYCRITPEGDVTPCPYLPLVGGNVRNGPFAEIWQNAPLFRRLRAETPGGKCGQCDFLNLCGGCRARAFALTGKLLGEDPWCAYQPTTRGSTEGGDPLTWTPEAKERLDHIPTFIRQRVKVAIDQYAAANHQREVTPSIMTATLQSLGRAIPVHRPHGVSNADSASPSEGQP
ncbi:MAG: radical SAM protein [Chloroflexi bacterium]|nr:radical SAM protein [Chloroflexota bacterium]